MYRRIDDFINDWKAEEKATVKIFSQITDDVMTEKINDNVRTFRSIGMAHYANTN